LPAQSWSAVTFDVGDKVVYPNHGAAVIQRKETREILGQTREYLVLHMAHADLTVMVPTDKADEVGVRGVIRDDEVEDVFAVLRKKEKRTPTNWSRRFKNHTEKLRSGDIYETAEVVRNLSVRKQEAHLSEAEQRMLREARRVLVSELHLAMGVSEDEAGQRIDDELG
jgi:CarD family transcriptional regulator